MPSGRQLLVELVGPAEWHPGADHTSADTSPLVPSLLTAQGLLFLILVDLTVK